MHIHLVKCTPRNCQLTTCDIYAKTGVSRQLILAANTHNLKRLDLHVNLKSDIGMLRPATNAHKCNKQSQAEGMLSEMQPVCPGATGFLCCSS